ncbi:hypothetical protein [Nocardioides pelophilus]|uniref:hypothetical protein n=1 Tax=Nocardioides pelophilus TaxID=2172019 RepID=UPI001FE50C1C|nr:hypothetical protein [Nocardioides pelophilus]
MTPDLRTGNPTNAMTQTLNWSNEMNLMHEDLARAHMDARLGEAQQLREAKLARARRVSRKAERAAQQARLALARAL